MTAVVVAMALAVITGAGIRELIHKRLSANGYEYATLLLVMASIGVTIAGLDGIAHG